MIFRFKGGCSLSCQGPSNSKSEGKAEGRHVPCAWLKLQRRGVPDKMALASLPDSTRRLLHYDGVPYLPLPFGTLHSSLTVTVGFQRGNTCEAWKLSALRLHRHLTLGSLPILGNILTVGQRAKESQVVIGLPFAPSDHNSFYPPPLHGYF